MQQPLSVLVLGGDLVLRGAVYSDLTTYDIAAVESAGHESAPFSAAVLIHPEAMTLVAAYRASMPVVVVTPESDELVERYLADGVEEIVSTEDVFRPGFLWRAVRRALARRCSVAKLEQAVRIDPLTELLNRRGMAEALIRVSSRAVATAIFLDVDDFKSVNESRGYLGGDALLRDVANAIRRHARPTDLVARYAGDEFLLLLPNTGFGDACAVAERLRAAVAHTGVTVSVGVADATGAACLDDLVASTQALVMDGKRMGKNRVACELQC